MELIYLIIGIAAGFAIAWLFFRMKAAQNLDGMVRSHQIVTDLKSDIQSQQNKLDVERTEKQKLAVQLATSEGEIKSLNEKLSDYNQKLIDAKAEFKTEFENLANRIFDDKSKKVTEQNRVQLDLVLSPLKDKLREFELKVEKVYGDERDQRIDLKKEITQLAALNSQLSGDANNLANALKGDNKMQGNWGEFILEKILERSGLNEGVEYKTQDVTVNAEGERIKPDVVVYLPENKHLIIDSKVSLTAYNNFISADNDEEKGRQLKLHIASVRSHIKLLGEKNYETGKNFNSPDFVLLFMPIEAAFAVALQNDGELYDFAWKNKIVIVSPTTLLATLRTVSSIWMQERRVLNAEAIAEEGGKLYDKFVSFTDDMIGIGNKMDSAKKEYEEAMKKLSTGTGNLVNRALKMQQLGVKSKKQINQNLVEGIDQE